MKKNILVLSAVSLLALAAADGYAASAIREAKASPDKAAFLAAVAGVEAAASRMKPAAATAYIDAEFRKWQDAQREARLKASVGSVFAATDLAEIEAAGTAAAAAGAAAGVAPAAVGQFPLPANTGTVDTPITDFPGGLVIFAGSHGGALEINDPGTIFDGETEVSATRFAVPHAAASDLPIAVHAATDPAS